MTQKTAGPIAADGRFTCPACGSAYVQVEWKPLLSFRQEPDGAVSRIDLAATVIDLLPDQIYCLDCGDETEPDYRDPATGRDAAQAAHEKLVAQVPADLKTGFERGMTLLGAHSEFDIPLTLDIRA